MYQDALTAVAQGAEKKARLFSRHPLGALISTMLAGAYIGFGVILVFTVGGTLSAAGSPYTCLLYTSGSDAAARCLCLYKAGGLQC